MRFSAKKRIFENRDHFQKPTRMKKFLSLAVMILLTGSVCTQAQTKAERKAREAETVKTRLENRDYTIEVLTVHPMGGRSIQVTPDFTLTVKGDSVRSVLPYFGRAYTVPYGGGNGLRFEAVTRDYRQEYNKKRKETQKNMQKIKITITL